MESARLPLMFAALVAIIGTSRFEETRPAEAVVIALMVPLGLSLRALGPFREGSDALRRAALLLGLAFVTLTELSVAGSLFPHVRVLTTRATLHAELAALLLSCALALELVGLRRGMVTRCTAWLALASAFTWWLAAHPSRKDPLASVFVALFVGLLGSAAGLLASGLGTRLWVRRSSSVSER